MWHVAGMLARGEILRIVCGAAGPVGEAVHAQCLAEHLAGTGPAVEVWMLVEPGAEIPRAGSGPRLIPAAGAQSAAERAETLAGALRAAPPARVLHAEDVVSGLACTALRPAGGPPVVRTVHHLATAEDADAEDRQRASLAGADRRVCASRYWAERIEREFDVGADVVPNGVDAAHFRSRQLSRAAAGRGMGWGRRPTVLSVGGIGPRKGSLTLLEAFARAQGRIGAGALLAIVGGGAAPPGFVQRFFDDAERLGLRVDREQVDDATDVVLLPTLAADAMPGLYRAADAFALPSTREGFGLAALEAAAAGRPVVLSDLPVFREIFTPERDCLMAPAGHPTELADLLVRATRDDDLRRRLAAEARQTAAHYTWDAAATAYGRIYAEVLEET